MENSSDKHFIIIDGYGFVFRAYHAMPPLNSPDGVAVGAVFGFISMLLKLFSEMSASHAAVVFDSGRKSFRSQIYPAYKANRPPAPEDLIVQFPIVREAALAMNLTTIEKEGFEADDIIATLADMALKANESVTIVSSDKDLMQLIDGKIKMFDPMKSKFIASKEVIEKFGVAPNKLLDVLSLMGDSSDNIPGVPGVGPKTAAELINEFGSLDNLFIKFRDIRQDRRRKLIEDNIDAAKLSRQLISLAFDVPINMGLDDLIVKEADPDKFFTFLNKYGFKRLNSRAEQFFSVKKPIVANVNNEPTAIVTSKIINNIDSFKEIIPLAQRSGKIAFCLHDNIFSIATNEQTTFKIELENTKKAKAQGNLLEVREVKTYLNLTDISQALEPIFKDNLILKIGHNIKAMMHELKESKMQHHDDIMIMSYVVNNGLNSHDLASLIEKYFGITLDISQPKAGYLFKLHHILEQQLFDEKLITLYKKCESPLTEILYKMENYGVKIDRYRLKELSDDFAKRLRILEQEIFNQSGCEFNIGSPKQLAEVLFSNMGLSGGKISKTGNYSTNVDILEQLVEQGHKIAEDILDWRHLAKLKNTYSDALPLQINPLTGRVHSNFSMAATSTGRLSSSEPNLQNIPIRSEEGNKIRSAFIAEKNCKLISADYSQIELRLLAHMANIPVLKQAFKENKDIHTITASQIFGVPQENVDPAMRRKAKAINFGIIYGISGFGLAKQLDISRSEASEYIKAYFKEYPGIESYMEQTKQFAHSHGFVTTLMGRKCHFPAINDKNGGIRSFTERAAINAPLQGTAADIIKKAMIAMDRILVSQNHSAKMILQVHDELLFEVPEKDGESLAKLIKTTMENIIQLDVPLSVGVSIGNSWADIH